MKLMIKLREALCSLQCHATPHTTADRNVLRDVEIAISRCTVRSNDPADENYVHEILFLVSNAPGSINFLARRISVKLESERNPVVALKTLVLVHRLLRGGDRFFEQDLCNLWWSSELRIDLQRSLLISHRSLGQFTFNYSQFLKDRMEWIINQAGNLEPIRPSSSEFRSLDENGIEVELHRLSRCQKLLDRMIDCLPLSVLGSNCAVRLAMSIVLKESFKVYASFCEGTEIVCSSFYDLKKAHRVLALDIFKKACNQAQCVHEFYENCKRIFGCKSFEYPSIKINAAAEISEQFTLH